MLLPGEAAIDAVLDVVPGRMVSGDVEVAGDLVDGEVSSKLARGVLVGEEARPPQRLIAWDRLLPIDRDDPFAAVLTGFRRRSVGSMLVGSLERELTMGTTSSSTARAALSNGCASLETVPMPT